MNEQILVEAARIYDNRELRDEEDGVRMMKGNDLISYAMFLSKQDAFTKVDSGSPRAAVGPDPSAPPALSSKTTFHPSHRMQSNVALGELASLPMRLHSFSILACSLYEPRNYRKPCCSA